MAVRMKMMKASALGAIALAAFSAAAGPRVEIVEAWQKNPGSGIVDFTYEVGDLEDGACDLEIKVGAAGVTPVAITHTNVTAGTVTTNVDVKALLGKASASVTLSASLRKPGVPQVEIADIWREDAARGIVGFTCVVGDLGASAYDLTVRLVAKGTSQVVLAQENVTSGMVTTNVDVRALLGETSPNVTLVASLAEVPHSVRLWKDGPCWAECNVGATSPEDVGCYFWWGDTTGYRRKPEGNGWMSVADSSDFRFDAENCPTYGKDLAWLQAAGYVDPSGELLAAHDAATVRLGSQWRMPTKAEFAGLAQNCTCVWTNLNGVSGQLVTGRGAYSARSLFFPAGGSGDGDNLFYLGSFGSYWSSSSCRDGSGCSWNLDFNSVNCFCESYDRCYGQPVRPVLSSRSGPPTGTTSAATVATSSASLVDTHADLLAEFLPEGCPIALSLESGNRLRLTLTDDISGGLTLPEDIGALSLVLDGWSIRGVSGAEGSAIAPGGNGGAAIAVMGASGAESGATEIVIKSALPSDATGTPIGVASAVGDVMVVNLERNAQGRFPVHFYRHVDMGVFNCDVYKTRKIALRRIPKGEAYPVEAHAKAYPITATLTPRQDFYVALFEITNAQYDRVMNASSVSVARTPMRYASYSVFRSPTGATQLDPPEPDTFIGVLLANAVDGAGVPVSGFDLPTASQWEIAARAGSTGEYGAYLDAAGALVEGTSENVAAFAQTGSGHVVGSLRPNAWGLYDMCGGVGEWCRNSGQDVETAVKGAYWPFRGNAVTGWEIGYVLSEYNAWTSYSGVNCGARLSCTLDVPESAWAGVCGGNGGSGHPAGKGMSACVDTDGNRLEVEDPLGVCADGPSGDLLVALPTGLAGYAYVVSNLTAGAEVGPADGTGFGGTTYALPFGAKVGICAVPAAGYVVRGLNPVVIEKVTEETQVDADRLPKAVAFVPPSEVRTLAPFLHELWYGADYACMTDETTASAPEPVPSCAGSAVRNGRFLGRNFDGLLDDVPCFVVHLAATEGRFASVGVARQRQMCEDGVTNGLYVTAYDRVPNVVADGINECGVSIAGCMVASVDGVALTGTNPDADDLHVAYVPRYVLDHATSARHAVELIRSRNVVGTGGDGRMLHFMIADAVETLIVEFVGNEVVARHLDRSVLTNFGLNWDNGRKVSVTDETEGWNSSLYPQPWNPNVPLDSIDRYYAPESAGVERFLALRDGYAEGADFDGMFDLMRRVRYSRTFEPDTSPMPVTELLVFALGEVTAHDGGETVACTITDLFWSYKNDSANFSTVVGRILARMKSRLDDKEESRKLGNVTWQTVHAATYDLEKRMFRIAAQEEYDRTFDIWLVKPPAGSVDCPWPVGAAGHEHEVTASTNGLGGLVIEGAGSVGSMPWTDFAADITRLQIEEGVTADLGALMAPLTSLVSVNGLARELFNCAVPGGAAPDALGALKAAGFSAIAVDPATQKAKLTLVVKRAESLDAEPEDWTDAGTAEVQVDAKSPTGFFVVVPTGR